MSNVLAGNRKLAAIIAGVIGVGTVGIVGPYTGAPVEVTVTALGIIGSLCGLNAVTTKESG